MLTQQDAKKNKTLVFPEDVAERFHSSLNKQVLDSYTSIIFALMYSTTSTRPFYT